MCVHVDVIYYTPSTCTFYLHHLQTHLLKIMFKWKILTHTDTYSSCFTVLRMLHLVQAEI